MGNAVGLPRLPLVIILTTSVLIPALAVVSGQPEDPRWTSLTFFVLAVGLVFVVVVPRSTSAWARRIIKNSEENDASSTSVMVLLATANGALEQLAVLQANETGIWFRGKSSVLLQVGWDEVASISVLTLGNSSGEAIEILGEAHRPIAQFLLMKPNGSQRISMWKNDGVIGQIAARRPRVH